jgi:hypothetical protein
MNRPTDIDTRHIDTRWLSTATAPVSHFRLPHPHVPLTTPVPDIVLDVAANAFTQRHHLDCVACGLLRGFDGIVGRWHWRIALTGGPVAAFYPLAAKLDVDLGDYLITSAIIATLVVHGIFTTGVLAALLHRARMRDELAVAVERTRLDMMRPGQTHTEPQPSQPTAPAPGSTLRGAEPAT